MGLKLPAATQPKDLANVAFMARVLDQAKTTVSDGTITDDAFADRAGNTLIGRSANTPGKPSDIGLAPNQFLANRSGTLVGTTIQDTDIPSAIARDSEVATAASAAQAAAIASSAASLAAHVAAADPHTQYRLESVNVPYTEISSKPAVLSLLYSGTGSPESAVTAGVGSLYLRTNGGANTTLYIKESGVGNTGWIAK